MNPRTIAAATGYIATIPTANLLVQHVGPVPVGFGLVAPAGVFMAGAALVLRDLLHELAGRWGVLATIVAGTAVSYLMSAPALATASAVAFLVAELADMAVYTPLRRRGLLWAVAGSNAVGLVVDSVLFLHLAFGSLAFLPGQILAKTYMTAAAVAALAAWRARRAEVTA